MPTTFTSESVSHGHPDKIADQISDAILDEYIKQDPSSRTAIETMVTKDNVIVAGEVKGPDSVNNKIEEIVRNTIKNIGYESKNFHWNKVKVTNLLHQQSGEIAAGVEKINSGAGDQGMMFGYATNETDNFMPAPIYYAHKILKNIFKSQNANGLGPDGKSQVTLLYHNGKPLKATNIIVSIQHHSSMMQQDVRHAIYETVKNTFPKGWMCHDENFLVNPTGRFINGGPVSDCGLTGRKIIVDTYGGMVAHGGGAFSGKDSTKVDRSAAYMARYLAKNIVSSALAEKCLIGLAYAIGIVEPLSFTIDTYNTSKINESEILDYMRNTVDLSPTGIRKTLKLDKAIYLPTATYGHFGRTAEKSLFSWEKLDLESGDLMKKAAV